MHKVEEQVVFKLKINFVTNCFYLKTAANTLAINFLKLTYLFLVLIFHDNN